MPDLAALKSAARAAIVMPAVFALADKVVAQPQTSIFAAFGSFAMLVLVEFGGPWRVRLLAYLGLAGVGAAFITLGTLCSRDAWLAAGGMAAVGFATLFSGVISGYFAAGATGALLTFVLPVTIPAPNAAIPALSVASGGVTGSTLSNVGPLTDSGTISIQRFQSVTIGGAKSANTASRNTGTSDSGRTDVTFTIRPAVPNASATVR